MANQNKFNPAFSQLQARKKRPDQPPPPPKDKLQRFRGALAVRSRKVKPSMPKLPGEA